MKNRIENISEIILIGKSLKMTYSQNRTAELWKSFMPFRNSIKNKVGQDYYSIEIYGDADFFKKFDPNKEYEKWAAIKVEGKEQIPQDMKILIIPEGDYAVFNYKGKSTEAGNAYQYIMTQWMPNSAYLLDNRPHFAIMGEKYQNDHPESEEELWVPIKFKNK